MTGWKMTRLAGGPAVVMILSAGAWLGSSLTPAMAGTEASATAPVSGIATLDWMAGHWAGVDGGTASEEHWTGASGGGLVGMHKDV
ncbi:MAG: hypothetical protein FD129_2585, partial [bacterium]